MNKKYAVAIIIAGVISAGLLIISFNNSKENDDKLTESKLLENASPVFGNENAKITILEWGDYQCTYCYKFHTTTLNIINEEYIKTGKARLFFRDFPLNGQDSVLAAEAAYCAGDQRKYWDYHDEIYKNWAGERTGWVTRDSLNEFGNTVELDTIQFNECLDSKKYHQRVLDHYSYGQKIGIDATPSFLIFNNEKVIKITGNQPLEVFQKVIDELY